jgi:neutral ceramidase
MGDQTYLAGVGRTDITPPIGIRLCGYAVREGFSHGVEAPLTATALVLRARDATVCFLALDLTIVSLRCARFIRERCAQALGIDVAGILVNVNHTHAAATLPDFQPYESPDQAALQRAYEAQLLTNCVTACRLAAEKLEPARIAVGWGECRGNINRRQKLPDGTVLLGEDPNGPCDPSVGVLRVDRLDGTPLAVGFRFSCHPVTLGPRTNVISPDFPGRTRALIERELGCPSLFLQGCAGNQNPISGVGSDARNFEDTARLGQILGGEILKVCGNLRTHRRRGAPKLVKSVAPYWLYEYESVATGSEATLRAAEIELDLPLTPFPTLAEVQQERADLAAKWVEARSRNAPEWERNVAQRFDYWSELRLKAAEKGDGPTRIRFPVQAWVLGDMAVIGLPFEPMAETGLAIRADSPYPNTFVLGYSNGVITYLPTPEVSRAGGMEARLGYKNYLLPSAIPGDWEPQIRQAALKLLQK